MKRLTKRQVLPVVAAAAVASIAFAAAGLAGNKHAAHSKGAAYANPGRQAQPAPGRSRSAREVDAPERMLPASASVPVVAELGRNGDLVDYRSRAGHNCTALLSELPSQVDCGDVAGDQIHFLGFGPRLELGADGVMRPTSPARSWGEAPEGTVAVRYVTPTDVQEFPVFESAGRGHTFFVTDFDVSNG